MLVDDEDYFEFKDLFTSGLYSIGRMSNEQEYQIYGFVKALVRDDFNQHMTLENISEKSCGPGQHIIGFLITSFEKYNTEKMYSDEEKEEMKREMEIICQEAVNMTTCW